MKKLALPIFAAAVAAAMVLGWWLSRDEGAAPGTGSGAPVAEPAQGGRPATDPVGIERLIAPPTAPQAAAVAADPCRVLVLDASGAPVAGAGVHVWTGENEPAGRQLTDALGRCSFSAVSGPGGLLVVVDQHLPVPVVLPELQGEHPVRLTDGATIEGTLLVDGQPGIGWRMRLLGPAVAEVPEDLRLWCAEAACDRNGAFRFVGLPAGGKGRLQLPQALWLVSGPGDAGEFAAPCGGIELRATRLPGLSGRVVWSDDGTPVPWPGVDGRAEFADGQSSPTIGSRGRADGSFTIGFHGSHASRSAEWCDPARRPATKLVRLWVADQDRSARVEVEYAAEQLAAATEVRIELPRPPRTHVLVLDAAGAPIAGARVVARGISAPSDASGQLSFCGRPDEVKLVGSPRHRVGPVTPRAAAAGTAEDPLVFVLESTNVVRFRVEGAEAARLHCVVRCDVDAFAGGRMLEEIDRRWLASELQARGSSSGRTMPDGSSRTYDSRVTFTLDAHDTAELRSLEPGLACQFQVLDDMGRPLATQPFVAPAWGSTAEVVAELPARIAGFAGVVTGPDGQLMAGVTVAFRCEGAETTFCNLRTDERGRFELTRAGDLSHTTLRLRCRGYAEQVHTDLVAGLPPRTFVLEKGRELTLQVVGEDGNPVDVTPFWRTDRAEEREHVAEGVFRWRDLPSGVVELCCRIGAEEYLLRHDTAVATATLQVPRPGQVRLVAEAGWPKSTDARSSLVAIASCRSAVRLPVRILVRASAEPTLLLPGEWHVDLIEMMRQDAGLPVVERSTGIAGNVVVRAGETATATLR